MLWLVINYVLISWMTYSLLCKMTFNGELGLYLMNYYKITPDGLDFRLFIISIIWPILIIYYIKNLL